MPNVKRLKKVQESSSSHEEIKTSDQFKVNSQHCDFDLPKNQTIAKLLTTNSLDLKWGKMFLVTTNIFPRLNPEFL